MLGGSTRLRWVSENSKHRRTATRQRRFRCSLLEQFPPDTAEARVPPENRSLEIIREAASCGLQQRAQKPHSLETRRAFVNRRPSQA